jgi:diaminopimelate decarboxylase
LKSYGYNADVAGLFELQLALKLGFTKIIFTGPGKSLEELKLAIAHKDKVIINVDNTDELDRIIGLSDKGVRVSIRVNPDSSVMKNWSKFGVDLKDLKGAIAKVKSSDKVKLVGLHFHSSWNDTPIRYCKNIKLIGEFL